MNICIGCNSSLIKNIDEHPNLCNQCVFFYDFCIHCDDILFATNRYEKTKVCIKCVGKYTKICSRCSSQHVTTNLGATMFIEPSWISEKTYCLDCIKVMGVCGRCDTVLIDNFDVPCNYCWYGLCSECIMRNCPLESQNYYRRIRNAKDVEFYNLHHHMFIFSELTLRKTVNNKYCCRSCYIKEGFNWNVVLRETRLTKKTKSANK